MSHCWSWTPPRRARAALDSTSARRQLVLPVPCYLLANRAMKREIAGPRRRKYPLHRLGGHDLGIHLSGVLCLIDTRSASHKGHYVNQLTPTFAPAGPPCAWPRPPSPRPMSGPATNRPRDPGCARLFTGMGEGLSRPQREAGALTADVLAVSSASPQSSPAGRRARQVRPGLGCRSVRRVVALIDAGQASHRGGGADLGRRAALG